MGELRMSARERKRLELLSRVKEGVLKLVKAAEMSGLSYRQMKRIWKRYREQGDAGLIHQGRGRRSNRRIEAALREKILARYQERYPDFGPTLASEYLAQEKMAVDHETLRRWLLEAGLWQKTRRRQKHRQRRERRPQRGELIQMDGSHHDWFEGRRDWAVLMVMIDDATNRTYARFYEGEDTRAAMDVFGRYARRWGLPQALYVDHDSIYECTREARIDEQLRGEGPQTQFDRAMKQLAVEVIPANSPQAKGRVERRHGVFQDRLVKAMRLKRTTTLEAANQFLEDVFLPDMNRRFTVAARERGDLHRPIPAGLALKEILCLEEPRVVQNDWTVRWRNRWFQVEARHEGLNLAGKQITIRERLDRSMALLWRGRFLRYKELPARPIRTPTPRNKQPRKAWKPAPDHPWKNSGRNQMVRKAARMGRLATATPSPACPSEKGTLLSSSNRGHF